MKDYFYHLGDVLTAGLEDGEVLLLAFDGEESDFVRFNQARVRQAGSVVRRSLEIDLIEGARHAGGRVELSGDAAQDQPLLMGLLAELRHQRHHLPEDPYIHYATGGPSGDHEVAAALPPRGEALEAIRGAAAGLDLAGIWAAGTLHSGFASSLGQRNWHTRASFNLDWSCHHTADKAVKANYAGLEWNPAMLEARMATARRELGLMAGPPRTIEPGRYRAYLAPRAMRELLSMMAWGGFGLKSQRTGQSPLLPMSAAGARFASTVHLAEHNGRGLEPPFSPEGFAIPPRVPLIDGGRYGESLVGPRSAMEYGLPVNAAAEFPGSLDMAAGELPAADVLATLGTGLYLNDLWYLNFSDRSRARVTGMTRFACFWVEDGRSQAPLNVMRFDDTLFDLLGPRLEGLTRERELLLDAGTYGGRSSHSHLLPGALVNGMTFTL
ncbi:MAG: metallopeptidase TldD-related protein [Gammaproteobacteria bacterium]|nr:metallopeptidase TldD-related protein [Gammaproteobacteria bacterium]